MEKIEKTIRTKSNFWDRLKNVISLWLNGGYHTIRIEDPKDFESWLLLQKIKSEKKRKKFTFKKFFVSLWYNYRK